MNRRALSLTLALLLAGAAEAATLRIPALPGATASVRLVDAADHDRQVLGFEDAEWATTYLGVPLDQARDLDLTPTAAIATAAGLATCYRVIVRASGGRGYDACVQLADIAGVQDLRDLVAAEAIDPADITAGRLLSDAERAALNAASDPSGANALATVADLTAAAVTSVDGQTGAVDLSGSYDPAGTAATALSAHEAAGDPHPDYTTSAEAAAAAPVQSVDGQSGAVDLSAVYRLLADSLTDIATVEAIGDTALGLTTDCADRTDVYTATLTGSWFWTIVPPATGLCFMTLHLASDDGTHSLAIAGATVLWHAGHASTLQPGIGEVLEISVICTPGYCLLDHAPYF